MVRKFQERRRKRSGSDGLKLRLLPSILTLSRMNSGSRDLGCSQIQVASMDRYNRRSKLQDSRLSKVNGHIESVAQMPAADEI